MTSRLFVALDTPDLARAQAIATRVRHHVGGLKLGLEFFAANGQPGVRAMAELGLPIFLDLKLHDIPNTVAKAVQALHALEPAILTVHAAGGRAMLEDAKAAAWPGTKVVAVTMLTSLDAHDLAATGVGGSPHDHVAGPSPGDRASAREGALARRLFCRSRRPPGERRGGRPEACRHAARRAGRGRVHPRHRPPHHAG